MHLTLNYGGALMIDRLNSLQLSITHAYTQSCDLPLASHDKVHTLPSHRIEIHAPNRNSPKARTASSTIHDHVSLHRDVDASPPLPNTRQPSTDHPDSEFCALDAFRYSPCVSSEFVALRFAPLLMLIVSYEMCDDSVQRAATSPRSS